MKILTEFKIKGKAQFGAYNEFCYIKETPRSVYVTREKGKDTPVSHKRLLIGINAYKQNRDLYYGSPTDLRAYGITHVTSPIYALLHLLPHTDYI